MLPSLLSVFLSSLLLLLTQPTPLTAQTQTYSSHPVISHTFDVEVQTNTLPLNTSSFTWSRGLQPHEGMVQFNGFSDYIDLYQLMDDYGHTMPTMMSRSMSFEFWVKWKDLNQWSRILDCGNGPFADNIIVSNVEARRDLRAAFYYDAQGTGLNSIAYNAITVNNWQHIVVTVRAKRRGDYDSPDSAEINIYVDGALYSNNSNTWLPRQVVRRNCFIGLSEWYLAGQSTGDGFFSGWLDDFFYYDYPLSAEAVLAHYVLPRPPVYELTFSSDPRLVQGQAYNYTYSWTDRDPRDTSDIMKFHDGFLNLTGNQYIDLQNRYGNSSVGVAPPPIIGGMSGGNGTLDEGWSFEILFKPQTHERFAKLFDFGNGEWVDNIGLGYEETQPLLRFELVREGVQSNLPLVNLVLGRWYHIIIVLRPMLPRVQGVIRYANVTSYIDGVAGPSIPSGFPWPAAVFRNHSYLGKSNWQEQYGDEFFDALLDTFRIYDYALTAQDAASLYHVTHEELPRDANRNQTQIYSYHTGPVTSLTFTSRPSANDMIEGTNFLYEVGDSGVGQKEWPHRGLAVFSGNRVVNGGITGNYINLWTYPTNAARDTFPHVVGGPMSIECWVRFRSLQLYSRILDIGSVGGSSSHNIILGQWGDTNGFMFEVYSGSERSFLHVPNVLPVGEWVHIVASVDQISRSDSWSATSALLTLYVNGKAVGTNYGFVPQRMPRPSAYIGRSNWAPNDYYLDAQIDSFFLYDYALQAEQVAAHYLLPMPPVFELAFTKDPRPWVGDGTIPLNQFTYKWRDFNASDFISNSTTYHNGYLVFDDEEFVNLSATTGPNSIGTTLPPVLFGDTSSGRTLQNARWNGWSIEALVKLNKMENGAKMFSFSNGQGVDEVDMGYEWTKRNLVFVVYGGANGRQGSNFICVTDVNLEYWYHIIVVLIPSGQNMADIVCYVDGKETARANNGVYMPRAVRRHVTMLARSPWQEDTMDMHLDTFRIYDIAIDADYASQLYALTTSDAAQLVKPLYTSRPILAYTFDYDVGSTYSDYGDGTNYGWIAQDGQNNQNPHYGVATFDGHSNWINLLQWPDDRGVLFPPVIGGDSMAFEAWVKWDTTALDWSRILDMGNAAGGDNILFGQEGSTRDLAFHVYRPNATEVNSVLNTAGSNAITANAWIHVVASITDLSDWPCLGINENSLNATYMTVHVNGRLVGQRRGLLPRSVPRSFAYLGRSHWSDNSLFSGRIDSFYYYDHALSTEQINVHYRLPKPPVLDLSFSADPRWTLASAADINQFTYSWQEYDPTDSYSNNTRSHSGHLVLTGQRNSWVNLSQPMGMSSVGTLLPMFGGRSDGVDAQGRQAGWSIEMIVKLDTVGRWAKLIDWGQPADIDLRLDNVQFGYAEESSALELRVYNAEKGVSGDQTGYSSMIVVPSVVLGRWYHIVVTMEIESVTDFLATWSAYVDGLPIGAPQQGMYLPRGVNRPSALIGASNWYNSNPPDAPFAAKIDAIRMYDYSLNFNQISELHRLTTETNRIPNPLVPPMEPVCHSPPPAYASSSSSTAAMRPSSSTGRSSSSSTAAVRPVVPTSSPRGAKCKWYATGYEPDCRCWYGGTYPNRCYCPTGDTEVYYPYCTIVDPDDPNNPDNWWGESSSTGVAPSPAGPSSSLIAGVVVALLFVAAAAGFVYFRYFRTVPKTSDDGVALLGAPPAKFATTTTGNGSVTRDNGLTDTNGGGEYYRHTDTNETKPPAEGASHGVELL